MLQALAISCFLVITIAVVSSDEIVNLPGLPTQPTFKQYSGYITANKERQRELFYWYTESMSNPAKDPLLLWLTGGPGCSGLLATLGENGPFTMLDGGKSLAYTDYPWNKEANVIWIESPAGVGFSTVSYPEDLNANDVQTANDTYTFLLEFIYDKFPEFIGREFYITGESYGGHYVPELALRIVQGNAQNPKMPINIKGFLVGNAWTYMPIDNGAAIDTWYQRGLVPQNTIADIKKYCNLSAVGPLLTKRSASDCESAISTADEQMGDISIYDIYADVCVPQEYLKAFARAGSKFHDILIKKNPPQDPCLMADLETYLNNPAVQQALHVKQPTKWAGCSGTVKYSYADVQKSVIPVYKQLFTSGLDILVYSGDVDAIVPWLGTQRWIDSLNMQVLEAWRPWHDSGNQVGGYVTKYESLTFTTVRNAGHQVPYFQPERAYIMLSNWIKYAKFPK